MVNRKGLISRMVEAIIASKFAPIEFVLACSSIVHGVWLFTVGWSMETRLTTITSVSRSGELAYSFYMVLAGILVLLAARVRWPSARKYANLALFVGWVFTSLLAFVASGVAGIIWIAYLTMAFVSAMVYLNVSIGVQDGND